MSHDFSNLKLNSDGLIPVVAQNAETGRVLMLAWMNQEAIEQTVMLKEAVYFSRSRNELWHKGATSGNVQRVVELSVDCDADSLLLRVIPEGPACHNGTESCFDTEIVSF
jgi:phosphoribosyl-AMP cyclohydrolase